MGPFEGGCHYLHYLHHTLAPGKYQFQRIARRDKKAFLNDQCKETGENNRMGKARGLFKKMRDTKGTFHATAAAAKMGTIKDRNGMDLREAEEVARIHRRTIQKNIFTTQITTMV